MEQHQPQTISEKKSFFEKYQTFFALIICGVLVGGGLVISTVIKAKTINDQNSQGAMTQEDVRKELITISKKAGVNKGDFVACLDNGTNTAKINSDIELADKSGVSGTPTFFVIKRTFGPDDSIISEKQIAILGARDLATFEESIAAMKSPAGQPIISGEKIVLSAEDHWLGPRRAEIVLVEYADIDCVYCKAAKPTIDELLKKHPEYAFVYRHAPIVSLHPFAAYKAEASECVKQLGGEEAFWKFMDLAVK